MEPVRPHLAPTGDLTREDMRAMQSEVAEVASFRDDDPVLTPDDLDDRLIAGIDQAFLDDKAVSAVVVRRGDRTVERAHAVEPLSLPYIPGYLSFREGGPIIRAMSALTCEPDLLLFDGSGRIHPRQAGIATHIGVVLDVPAVGVAKSLLCGTPRRSIEGLRAGAMVPIVADGGVDAPGGAVIGYAVQTRQFDTPGRHINPVYVSPGHRTSAQTAANLVLACVAGYKLPEPVRLADAFATEVKQRLVG